MATITKLVNVTRLYNSVSAAGYVRRIVALARDYTHRVAIGVGVSDGDGDGDESL